MESNIRIFKINSKKYYLINQFYFIGREFAWNIGPINWEYNFAYADWFDTTLIISDSLSVKGPMMTSSASRVTA